MTLRESLHNWLVPKLMSFCDRDHPTAHLFVSAIRMHSHRFRVFAYALSDSDSSRYRRSIEEGVEVFRNVTSWTTEQIVDQILKDGIHIRKIEWHPCVMSLKFDL